VQLGNEEPKRGKPAFARDELRRGERRTPNPPLPGTGSAVASAQRPTPNGRRRSGRKSDARLWRHRWGREERAQLLIEIAEGGIMEEERVINLGETFQKGAVRSQFVAAFYE
jgi:hypothetical protein